MSFIKFKCGSHDGFGQDPELLAFHGVNLQRKECLGKIPLSFYWKVSVLNLNL
jgi:hypothetical protein